MYLSIAAGLLAIGVMMVSRIMIIDGYYTQTHTNTGGLSHSVKSKSNGALHNTGNVASLFW